MEIRSEQIHTYYDFIVQGYLKTEAFKYSLKNLEAFNVNIRLNFYKSLFYILTARNDRKRDEKLKNIITYYE